MAYGQNMNAPLSGLMGLAAMKGRMGDNTLVHVNPLELKALNAMAPGGLTINPVTGLPEAFKLKQLLPILGAIAMPFAAPALLGGTAMAGLAGNAALMAGVGGAAGTALAGGNKKEILTSGLMSGIGAGVAGGGFGGAGSKVAGAQGAVADGATSMISSAAPNLTSNIGQNIARGVTQNIPTAAGNVVSQQVAQQIGSQAIKGAAGAGLASLMTEDDRIRQGRFAAENAAANRVATLPESRNLQLTQTYTPEDVNKYISGRGRMPRFFSYSAVGGTVAREAGGQAVQSNGTVDGNSYVMTAHEMAALGNGNPVEGMKKLNEMIKPVPENTFTGLIDMSKGSGTQDNVAFDVVNGGEVKTMLASGGEAVIGPNTVAKLGGGNPDAGAAFMDNFRQRLVSNVFGEKPKEYKL